jgi:uncharacterized protein YaeQ
MPMGSVPMQFRIALTNVDRALDRVQKVIVDRQASESAEHLVLRVLAWCILYDDDLRFGPGVSARNAADLWAHDANDKPTIWIECGDADAAALRKVMVHNRGIRVHVLFSDPERHADFLRQIADLDRRPAGFDEMTIWKVDPAFVAALASHDQLRQRWDATIVEDHLYIDCDGTHLESELLRTHPPEEKDRAG